MAWLEIVPMNQRPRFPFPRVLKMPLRDILRGVTTVADLTEEVLEPATTLLPGPMQSTFRSALAAFESAGTRAVTPRIEHVDIVRASAFLQGTDTSREALETFVNVLAFAWQQAGANEGDQHLLLSETVAAASLAMIGKGDKGEAATSYTHAAALLIALRKANAASRLPGIPMAPSEDESAYIDRTLLAASVWLLSERARDFVEEERLLELSLALIQALADEMSKGFTDKASLAEHLQNLANHL